MNARHWLLIGIVLLGAGLMSLGRAAPGDALLLEVRGAIGPATRDFIRQGIQRAGTDGAGVVILQMDTPGGLDSSMRDIIQDILSSPVPVATWVAPRGARAASAGTYILYASHVAAMSPATNLGAATPVAIGGGGSVSPGNEDSADEDDEAPEGGDGMTASERKAVNDAVAYIRGLAEMRGRNADWAERAVREAVSLSSGQALELGVIDLVATSADDLLQQMHGRTVEVDGSELTLDTENLSITRLEPDWRTRLLAVVTDPTVAYLLMLVGIYGLIFEGYNPGAIVPGVVGGVALLLALYSFQILPVNYAGLALILLGVGLIVAETFAPSFGALGLGGIIAFVIGSVILMDSDVPGFGVSIPLIIAIATVGGAATLGLALMAARTRYNPIVSGAEQMIGALGEAMDDFDGRGPVWVHAERWNGVSQRPVRKGQAVRVTAMHGLDLHVEPVNE